MIKKLLISSLVLFFALVPHVFAQQSTVTCTPGTFCALAPIPGLTEGATANTEGLANFFNNLYKYLIGLAAALAVVVIVWAGIRIALNQDSASSVIEAKGRIAQALFGLLLVLSPALVFSIINPSILNLSLNLTPLKTAPVAPPPASTSVVGSTQTCAADGNLTNCVTSAQSACTAAGGTPQALGGALGSPVAITCVPKNQNIVSPGSTITTDECAARVANSATVSRGVKPTIIPASTTADCNASNIKQLQLATGPYSYCANITGGGVCLYNQ